MLMRNLFTQILLVITSLMLISTAPVFAGPVKIKVAAVTPEGSTWVKVLRDLAHDVKDHTAGEVVMTIYAGGVSGDESDVLRKMRVKRIDAAGFSGVGLGIILPEIRVLEAPLLFRSNAEIDVTREQLFDLFSAGFDRKGFVLLGFVEGGWVYLFSRRNLAEEKSFRAAKMWVWKGDRVAEMLLHNFGIRTTPLHIADVNTGLETGMIDSYYSPPLAAIAFQWHARTEYMLDYPMANSNAALLMTKRAYSALSPAHQLAVKSLAKKHCRRLVEFTRRDNQEALKILQSQGVRFVKPGAGQLDGFMSGAQKTYRQSIPALYSSELFDRIQSVLAAHRKEAAKE
jgi:TRAP-type C4-dicarboxylate transport system substrate-binding protein